MRVLACGVAFLITCLIVPMMKRLAWRIGAVDVPSDARRMHKTSVPRCGGGAIFLTVTLSWTVFAEMTPFLQRILLGGTLVFLIGLFDDVYSLSPWVKLIVQTVAAIIGVGTVQSLSGVTAILWVVMLINAHNFIDGLDGLLTGCATVETGALGILLFLVGQKTLVLPTLLIGSSCLGFRIYNRHPAQIFAGDCGSGLLGFLLGMLSLPLFYEMRWSAGWLSPLLLFAYPITDLVAAVLRRVLRGKSPFDADKAHLHHRLFAHGLDQITTGRVLILLSALLAFVGIWACTGQYLFVASFACVIAASVIAELGTLFEQV